MRIRKWGDSVKVQLINVSEEIMDIEVDDDDGQMHISTPSIDLYLDREDCSELWTIFKRFAETGQLVDTEAK